MKTVKENFDLEGVEIMRVSRRNLTFKLVPLCTLRGCPGAAPLINLLLRHHLGYPIAYVTERYQRHWIRVLTTWRRCINKFRKPQNPVEKP